ncbi:MAG: hypothetical protein II983_02935, partial [Firmicutes bacterium]|nr:hypothetical protein [Bacillota bacterium]
VGQILRRNFGNPDIENNHFGMNDQVKQQVERPFKLAQFYLKSHGFLLSTVSPATGAPSSRLLL